MAMSQRRRCRNYLLIAGCNDGAYLFEKISVVLMAGTTQAAYADPEAQQVVSLAMKIVTDNVEQLDPVRF